MNCPSCGIEMQLRNGKFGEFFFCKNQSVCKQKTISKKATSDQKSNELYRLCKSAEVDQFSASLLEIHYQAARDHIEWLYWD